LPDSVLAAAARLVEVLAGLEPGLLSGADCARLAEVLAGAEKACAGVRLVVAARAVACGAHRAEGFSDGRDWLARQSGTTGARAGRELETARRLGDCPDTRAALQAGQISLDQAAEITGAQNETPGAEAVLLPVARTSDLSRLRDQARQHRQAHTQVDELHAQQHRARFFRHWRDRIGMVCFAGALPPETGLPFLRRVETAALRARRAARTPTSVSAAGTDTPGTGQPANTADTPATAAGRAAEAWERYAADGLAALTAGHPTSDPAPKRSERAELVIVCDLYAWRRGHPHPGEVCHLLDGGPIPVDLARQLGHDAFLAAVLHDGVNIHTVTRFGRYQPAELRTALDLGPIPAFTGRQCADCGRRWGLQYDHVDPVANHGPTSYANLQARCWPCHQHKTEHDRKAGLLGPHPPTRRPNQRT